MGVTSLGQNLFGSTWVFARMATRCGPTDFGLQWERRQAAEDRPTIAFARVSFVRTQWKSTSSIGSNEIPRQPMSVASRRNRFETTTCREAAAPLPNHSCVFTTSGAFIRAPRSTRSGPRCSQWWSRSYARPSFLISRQNGSSVRVTSLWLICKSQRSTKDQGRRTMDHGPWTMDQGPRTMDGLSTKAQGQRTYLGP